MYVLRSFLLFLACNVNVDASGVFLRQKNHYVVQKRSREARGEANNLFDICWGIMKKQGVAKSFFHSSQGGIAKARNKFSEAIVAAAAFDASKESERRASLKR